MLIAHLKAFGIFVVIALSLVSSTQTRAEDFLRTAETLWLNPSDAFEASVELEFSGADLKNYAEAIVAKIGGTIFYPSKGGALISKTQIGEIEITPIHESGLGSSYWRLTTDPMSAKKIEKLQSALNRLRKTGAEGSVDGKPAVLRFNLSEPKGVAPENLSRFYVNLLRNYLRPEHQAQIQDQLGEFSKKIEGTYSKEFLKRVANPKYLPSLESLLEDAVYRQLYELTGGIQAWTRSIGQIRSAVNQIPTSKLKLLLRALPIDIISEITAHFPGDPIARKLGAAKSIEFGEYLNDWNVETHFKECAGVSSMTAELGAIDHDRYLTSVTGLNKDTLQRLRAAELKTKQTGNPLVFRYFLNDPKQNNMPFYQHRIGLENFGDAALGVIPAKSMGSIPLLLRDHSVVLHPRGWHANSVLGEYNPGLVNWNISHALDNKWLDYLFFNKYAPGSMPETAQLKTFVNNSGSIEPRSIKQVIAALNERFPDGWVMKGVQESNTGSFLVTNKTQIENEIADYERGDFEKTYARLKTEMADRELDDLVEEMQKKPNYMGWKLKSYFNDPSQVIVQSKMKIAREFRVEMIGGKVLGRGSTLDRYRYVAEAKGLTPDTSPPELIRAVEKWAQNLIDRLPPELRGTPFGFDVALLDDERHPNSAEKYHFKLVEGNSGPQSGFHWDYKPTIVAMQDFLEKYPELVKRGVIDSSGMTPEAQMEYLKKQFAEWKIDVATDLKGFTFLDNHIKVGEDGLKPMPTHAEDYTLVPAMESTSPTVVNKAPCKRVPAMIKELVLGK